MNFVFGAQAFHFHMVYFGIYRDKHTNNCRNCRYPNLPFPVCSPRLKSIIITKRRNLNGCSTFRACVDRDLTPRALYTKSAINVEFTNVLMFYMDGRDGVLIVFVRASVHYAEKLSCEEKWRGR